MTHTVFPVFKTKRELSEACETAPETVFFEDPSIFAGAWSGSAKALPEGRKITVTNHPRRSWFATVERKAGRVIVK